MRHRKKGNSLGRTSAHRKAMLSNLVTSLFDKNSVITTAAKAKEARGVAERIITFAKKGDLASRRRVSRTVRDNAVVKKLYEEIAPLYENRPGGYTRILPLERRKGDGALLCLFELVGMKPELKTESKKGK
ncbi:50S ribosomal protein L17 [candidate division TA06 bacterium]|nr:50S ribosomal protein L17 [candidate division TA06 bacterium]